MKAKKIPYKACVILFRLEDKHIFKVEQIPKNSYLSFQPNIVSMVHLAKKVVVSQIEVRTISYNSSPNKDLYD